ncbi:hypothetical protein [Cellulomonas sp. NPDC089187]|uniref:hypothetical protein n=1 Tax=Cellulomonas sp. NPDC089187 TaxID=3154970 RepID=UPI00342FAB61
MTTAFAPATALPGTTVTVGSAAPARHHRPQGQHMSTVDPPSPTSPPSTSRPWFRRRGPLLATAAGVALALTATVVVIDHRMSSDLATAQDAWDSASTDLRAAVDDADELLAEISDQDMELDTSDLDAALVDAGDLLGTAVQTTSSRQARTRALHERATTATAIQSEVEEAASSLRTNYQERQLARVTADQSTALQNLRTQLESARTLLADSEGRVLDDANRIVLADAITTAEQAIEDAPTATGIEHGPAIEALTGHIDALSAAAGALSSAVEAVTADVAAWQAEQDRIAAEASTPESSESGDRPRHPTPGADRNPSGPTSTPPPAADPPADTTGDGGWVVEEETDLTACVDEHGNAWWC